MNEGDVVNQMIKQPNPEARRKLLLELDSEVRNLDDQIRSWGWRDFPYEEAKSMPMPEAGTDGKTGATKHDTGKLRWSLLPVEGIQEVVRVAMQGAKKYGDHNWFDGFLWSRPYDAAMRHMVAWYLGEDRDPEFGTLHTAHAAWNMLVLTTFMLLGRGVDDRRKG
jgi:hypothetical protein